MDSNREASRLPGASPGSFSFAETAGRPSGQPEIARSQGGANRTVPSGAEQVNCLVDRYGRVHTNLRLSVTDRCNIRCKYCMPEQVQFMPRRQLLTFEEIARVVEVAAGLGVNKLRLTGGEPLVRRDLPVLIQQLRSIPGIREVALTTNGILLADYANELKRSGLDRINVSLDSVDEEAYRQLTRREGLEQVLQGIAAAQQAGFQKLKINAVAIKGFSEGSVIPLARYCSSHRLELRFIEFMPFDGDRQWRGESVLTGGEILKILEGEFGESRQVEPEDPAQPAVDYEFSHGLKLGLISSVSQPFCGSCNRIRLTAEGQFKNCLFSPDGVDLRAVLRAEQSGFDGDMARQRLRELMLQCVAEKKWGHGMDADDFRRPDLAMYQIGG